MWISQANTWIQKRAAEFFGFSLSGMFALQGQFNLFRSENVYHYTDISGFISILQKQELWASHISFLNDISEYVHGKEMFRKCIKKKIIEV